jgi:phosphoglycerate dehydrogenase-like enzyme
VIATPHVGASTVEGQARVGLEVAEILLAEL